MSKRQQVEAIINRYYVGAEDHAPAPLHQHLARRYLTAACAAASLFAISAERASATIVLTTYTGTVSSGTDNEDWFGTPYANLAGDSFTVVYRTNDQTPGAITYSDLPYGSGISGNGSASPTSAVITIGGHDFSIAGDDYSDVQVAGPASGFGYLYDVTSDGSYYGTATFVALIIGSTTLFNPSADYHAPFTYAIQPADVIQSDLEQAVYCYGSLCPTEYITLDPTEVTVSLATGVPEPASWALLLLGFGGIGVATRYVKRPLCSRR